MPQPEGPLRSSSQIFLFICEESEGLGVQMSLRLRGADCPESGVSEKRVLEKVSGCQSKRRKPWEARRLEQVSQVP